MSEKRKYLLPVKSLDAQAAYHRGLRAARKVEQIKANHLWHQSVNKDIKAKKHHLWQQYLAGKINPESVASVLRDNSAWFAEFEREEAMKGSAQ